MIVSNCLPDQPILTKNMTGQEEREKKKLLLIFDFVFCLDTALIVFSDFKSGQVRVGSSRIHEVAKWALSVYL